MDQKFIAHLKKHGLYTTPERLLLFETLKSEQSPLSIAELIKITSHAMNETTVYRNLDLFEKIGVTLRIHTGWKYKVELSDTFSNHHHHMTCTNCNSTIPFQESVALLKELHKLELLHGFSAVSHSLELKGRCRNCC